MLKERIDKIRYIIDHRKTYRMIEKQTLGKNTVKGYLHDIDKIPLTLILGPDKASKLHRKYSSHHSRRKTIYDDIAMLIDWESARYTKPDKPLNARETLNKYYPELKGELEWLLAVLRF